MWASWGASTGFMTRVDYNYDDNQKNAENGTYKNDNDGNSDDSSCDYV